MATKNLIPTSAKEAAEIAAAKRFAASSAGRTILVDRAAKAGVVRKNQDEHWDSCVFAGMLD
jgi:hypothetical protein